MTHGTLLVTFSAGLGLLACERPSPADEALPFHELSVVVSASGLRMPDTIAAGWVRMQVSRADSAGHNVVLFQVPSGIAVNDFIAALDTAASITPYRAVAFGGVEGNPRGPLVGSVVIKLDDGPLVVGCISRDSLGHRHVRRGEWQHLHVSAVGPETTGTPSTIASAIDVAMMDFAFLGADKWPAGQHLLALRNTGRQEHLLLLEQLKPGTTIADWMNAPDVPDAKDTIPLSVPVGGATRMSPGRIVYLPVNLQPGRYVLLCMIPDFKTSMSHADLGMFREIIVE